MPTPTTAPLRARKERPPIRLADCSPAAKRLLMVFTSDVTAPRKDLPA
jgi:hypothetical protein